MHACPVGIDTGKLVKQLRVREHGSREERTAREVAARYGAVERAGRAGLRLGGRAARLWRSSIPQAAPELPFTVREGAVAVYLPSCINRIFGNAPDAPSRPSVPQALVAVSMRAGMPLWIPDDVAGHCCGLPWSSKGYEAGHRLMSARTRAALAGWASAGSLPVVSDATSCSHALLADVAAEGIEVIDSIEWVHDRLLERLEFSNKLPSVVVHPTCSSRHLGLSGKLAAIAAQISDDVVVPVAAGCCGMAGDRGYLHPELPASALRDLTRELDGRSFDACVSSNRTCEVALQQVTGRSYESFVLALEQLTRG
jgi:D-lactate dehydrogenase